MTNTRPPFGMCVYPGTSGTPRPPAHRLVEPMVSPADGCTVPQPVAADVDALGGELRISDNGHDITVWETVGGWVWSCPDCHARAVHADKDAAVEDAQRHSASRVPWWRRMFGAAA